MERNIPDQRYFSCERHSRRLVCTMLNVVAIITGAFMVSYAIQSRPLVKVETPEPPLMNAAWPVPCDAQANQPPFSGPFRPRPKPPPNPEPEPAPATDDDRRLFDRIRAFVDARADAMAVRAERRAEERAAAQIEQAFDEVGSRLEAFTLDQPQLAEGAFGAIFVTKLVEFVKKVIKVVINVAVIAALGAILFAYWPYLAAVVAGIVGLLRLWIGAIAAKHAKG